MTPDYQKVVEKIEFEKGYKTGKRKDDRVVVVRFRKTSSTPAFSYAPRTSEIASVIKLLFDEYGNDVVTKEFKDHDLIVRDRRKYRK